MILMNIWGRGNPSLTNEMAPDSNKHNFLANSQDVLGITPSVYNSSMTAQLSEIRFVHSAVSNYR